MWNVMMNVWQPMINLRDSVYSNPPKATFFLCLLILALSFICLSAYTYTHTLPNPDKTKVWTPLRALYFYRILKGSKFFFSQVIFSRINNMLDFCRTGIVFSHPYHSSSCVWKRPRVLLSLLHRPPRLWQMDTMQTILQPLLSLLCISRSLWLWLPTWTTAHSKALDCKLRWELSNSILEVRFRWIILLCVTKNSNMQFICPSGIEVVNLTLQFSCGVDGYTCLTISAPVHILPMDM